MTTPKREKFEKWFAGNYIPADFSLDSQGLYKHGAIFTSWVAFKSREPEIDALNAEVERLKAALSAAPQVSGIREVAALAVRDICELDADNPDDPQTICINVDTLQRIIEENILSAAPAPPEVEPVFAAMDYKTQEYAYIRTSKRDVESWITLQHQSRDDVAYFLVELFTSPPSPKAEEVDALKAEVAHWKANHQNMVNRSRVLMDRTDLPLERTKAFPQIGDYQAEIERLKTPLKAEYDADGNPLNLMAAAKDLHKYISRSESGIPPIGLVTNLRKFVGEES